MKLFNKAYSFYFVFVGFVLVLLTYIQAKAIKLILRKRSSYLLRSLYKRNSKIILFFQGIVPSVTGSFPNGTVVYCMNHQSDLDILIALALLPTGFLFVAKEELLKAPLIGSLIRMAEYITIDRNNARRSTETLDRIKDELKSGHSVLVFPEGTRSVDGEIQKVKRGGLQVAFQTRTEVVPVINDPLYKILNKTEKNIIHQKVKTSIGKPISFDWNNDSRNYSIDSAFELEKIMKEMLSEIRK
ncbi:MAG: lysophospholipid acyltransferase family protein [Candidatus Riflemargulisbacteria bacterium]